MIPIYMILSHLVADFLLQPKRLVAYKEKSFIGVLLHTLIHGTLMIIILFPYWAYAPVWYGIIIIAVLHAIIDQAKISMQLKTDEYIFPFLVDQFLHFLTIIGIIFGFHLDKFPIPYGIAKNFSLYVNPQFILFLTILIFCTAVYDIARFQVEREKHTAANYSFPWRKLGLRIFVAAIVFIGFLMIPLPNLLDVLRATIAP